MSYRYVWILLRSNATFNGLKAENTRRVNKLTYCMVFASRSGRNFCQQALESIEGTEKGHRCYHKSDSRGGPGVGGKVNRAF